MLRSAGLDFLEDCSVFRIDGENGTGYIRLGDAKCMVEPEWDRVEMDRLYLPPDAEPCGHFYIVWKDGHCGVILDDEGVIIPPVWDEIIPRRIGYQGPLSYSVRKGTQWGCCDASGQLICNAVWDEVNILLDGAACVKRNGRWGAIDAKGKLRIPVEWDEIDGFYVKNALDGAAAHMNIGPLLGIDPNTITGLPSSLSWVRKNGLWGLINRDGAVIAGPIWESHDRLSAHRYAPERMELQVHAESSIDRAMLEEEDGIASEEERPENSGNRSYYINRSYCIQIRWIEKENLS